MSGFPMMATWENRDNEFGWRDSIQEDLALFCNHNNIRFSDLVKRDRSKGLVRDRVKVARYLRDKGHKVQAIGDIIDRHHSTIVHYLNYYRYDSNIN